MIKSTLSCFQVRDDALGVLGDGGPPDDQQRPQQQANEQPAQAAPAQQPPGASAQPAETKGRFKRLGRGLVHHCLGSGQISSRKRPRQRVSGQMTPMSNRSLILPDKRLSICCFIFSRQSQLAGLYCLIVFFSLRTSLRVGL